MRAFLMALCGCLALGCGGDSGPTAPAVVYPKPGHWELTAVMGQPLPRDNGPSINGLHDFTVSGFIDIALPCCSVLFERDSIADTQLGSGGTTQVSFITNRSGELVMTYLEAHFPDLTAQVSGNTMVIGDSLTYMYTGPVQPSVRH